MQFYPNEQALFAYHHNAFFYYDRFYAFVHSSLSSFFSHQLLFPFVNQYFIRICPSLPVYQIVLSIQMTSFDPLTIELLITFYVKYPETMKRDKILTIASTNHNLMGSFVKENGKDKEIKRVYRMLMVNKDDKEMDMNHLLMCVYKIFKEKYEEYSLVLKQQQHTTTTTKIIN